MPAKLLAVSSLLRLLAMLPLSVQRRAGRLIGRAMHRWDKRSTHVSNANIALCFPQLSSDEQEHLCRESLEHTGMAFTELACIYYWSPAKLNALIQCDDAQVLAAAVAEGNGVILAAPHFGNWELIGQYLSQQHGMHILYRPAKNPHTDRYILERRSRLGAQLHPTNAGGVRGLSKALKKGELIGILPDQEPEREGGVFAPFFQQQALTMTLLSKLARRKPTPVLLSYMRRTETGFALHLERIADEVHSDDAMLATKTLNRAIEDMVKRYPQQYIWNYKRFAARPAGEKTIY